MEADKLYKVVRGNGNEGAGIILKGASVSVDILGSASKPESLSDLVDLTESGTITEAGAYSFVILPEWIYLDGTFDAAELVGWSIEKELGVLE